MYSTKKQLIPYIYPELYTKDLDSFFLTYNCQSDKGVRVLNLGAKIVYKLIDGKRNLLQIYKILHKREQNLTFDKIYNVIKILKESAVIYTNSSTPKIKFRESKILNTWIHITNQCNLRCTYCYVSKTPMKMSFEIGQKAIKAIFESAVVYKFKEVMIRFAGGESLLEYEKILALIKYAKDLAKKYQLKTTYVVLTNGTLLTTDRVKKLKKEKIHIFLSMDGLGKTHDLTRQYIGGRGSFKEVKRGLDLLIKYKVPCNVSVVVTKYNIRHLPKLTKLLINKNILITFNFFRENCNTPLERDLNDQEFIKGMKKIYRIIEKNVPKVSLMNTILDSIQFDRPRLFGCGIGSSYIVVRQDGSISDCQMTLEKSIGDINSDVITQIRKNTQIIPKNLTSDEKTGCKSCQWRYICAGGCAIATYKTFGRFDIKSPYCKVYKTLIPEVLKLEAKRILKYYRFNN